MEQVPRGVLADVLALLPPRTLAVSRCVCREWRDVVDDDARCQGQLRTDLLPVSVAGIFIMTNEADPPEFFVRPSMARKIASDLQSYLRMDKDQHGLNLPSISDCCNGLILFEHHVVNPATRQWMRLPPEEAQSNYDYWYLVFDPTLSPHFEVFSMKHPLVYKDESSECMLLHIYSSSTQRWEERTFLREEEEHITTTANVSSKLDCGWSARDTDHAVYRHGALYVYWRLTFITRINVSTSKYQLINLPSDINSIMYRQCRLGKSVGGVHFAVAGHQGLQIWFLDESSGKTEWVLKHVARHQFRHDQTDRPWILQHGPYGHDDDQQENNKEPTTTAENDSDWDSDADDAADIDPERLANCSCPYNIDVLGFHPYRNIVFLVLSKQVVAYHFNNSSKIRHLGNLLIRYHYDSIQETFIFTPTWIGELPGANYLVRKRNSYIV